MSVVIIGGNDCMVCQYKNLCKDYKCKAKVFTQRCGTMKEKIGSPDLLVLFTNTVSHSMIKCAMSEVDSQNTKVVRAHSSSMAALRKILDEHMAEMC
jgi:hypothetical protein